MMLQVMTLCSTVGGHQCFGGPAASVFGVQVKMMIFCVEMFAKLKMITASALYQADEPHHCHLCCQSDTENLTQSNVHITYWPERTSIKWFYVYIVDRRNK
jgi:hypothetical protein